MDAVFHWIFRHSLDDSRRKSLCNMNYKWNIRSEMATRFPPHKRDFDWISNSIKMRLFISSLASIRSHIKFAHSKTAQLSWNMQNFLCDWISFLWTIAKIIFTESEFDRIFFSGTGTRSFCDIMGNSLICTLVIESWLASCWPLQILTHCLPGNLDVIFKMPFSILFYWLESYDLLMMMPSYECQGTLLMISQHWLRWWLSAVREQGITWAIYAPIYSFTQQQLINPLWSIMIRTAKSKTASKILIFQVIVWCRYRTHVSRHWNVNSYGTVNNVFSWMFETKCISQ